MRGHAVAQGQGREERSAKAPYHAAVHQRDSRVDGGNRTQASEQAQPCPMQPNGSEREQRRGEDSRGGNSNSADIAPNADRPARSPKPSVRRRPKADPRLERG